MPPKSGEDFGLSTLQTVLLVIRGTVTTTASLDGDIPPILRRSNFIDITVPGFWFEHDVRSPAAVGDSTSTSDRSLAAPVFLQQSHQG
ncbi:MAG TPA: hypothetical protein PLY87_09055 [Planctomycetaceae bacterium]|nr:hypothetical protein [Planctomycetaceae bacterium]HQZ65211.1 hypothetical protein [Planctomycetaceae bacterium]